MQGLHAMTSSHTDVMSQAQLGTQQHVASTAWQARSGLCCAMPCLATSCEVVQDIVPRSGKLLVFKRGGQRVIINQRGDMLVRPPHIEASLRQVPGGTLPL